MHTETLAHNNNKMAENGVIGRLETTHTKGSLTI